MTTVTGDPTSLEGYTADTALLVASMRDAVAGCQEAISRFNSAGPNHLGTTIPDLTPLIDADLDLLAQIDRAPAAFAFALRNLDTLSFETDPWLRTHLTSEEWFDALSAAWLNDPLAPPDELVADARRLADTSVDLPWDQGWGPWASEKVSDPLWWSTTAIGGAATSVDEVYKRLAVPVRGYYRGSTYVAPHARWRPGLAPRLKPVLGPASTWRRLAPWARRIGIAGGVVPGIEQTARDWNDPTLTTGDRIARTGTTTLLEGGVGVAGGFAGAQAGATAGAFIGTLIFPGPGTAIGGVIGAVSGGIAGGFLGSEVGELINDNVQGAVEVLGDGVDAGLELGGKALDTLGDVGGGIVDGIDSLFG